MMRRGTGRCLLCLSAVVAGGCGEGVNDADSAGAARIDTIAGELIARFGRDGEGPGEFGHIGLMLLDAAGVAA